MKRIFVLCSFVSFVSISCNTPNTFEAIPSLRMITLIVDVATCAVLCIEVVMKLYHYLILKVVFFFNMIFLLNSNKFYRQSKDKLLVCTKLFLYKIIF